MSSLAFRVAAIVWATGLAACTTDGGQYYDDGIVESPPVGTHLKSIEGYQRGGSSSSVKVIGRKQIEKRQGSTADEVLRGN
jgi:hypothetical protein